MEVKSEETVHVNINRVGRPGNPIIYTHVSYFDMEYTVMKIKHNDTHLYGLIDRDDFDRVKEYTWHYISNEYLSYNHKVNGNHKAVYLHNLIMGKLEHPGKGAKESIDHISRNGLDNRKENLRLITQSAQNINQKQKERHIELPADSGVTVDEIPRHIWYIKTNRSHGDRFGIDLKTEGIKWKTTSSKNVSLQDKLKAAKEQLQVYYQQFPYLNPNDEEYNKKMEDLTQSYEAVIGMIE